MEALSDRNYVVVDHFLRQPLYTRVRAFFFSHISEFAQAGIGALNRNSVHREIRGDYTYWLDRNRDESLEELWGLVDETLYVFNRYCFLSLSGYEFHLAFYPPGGHYDLHLDQFQGRNNRMISVIIYLNEGWKEGDGGELEIHGPEQEAVLVAPKGGRCVLFKSAEVPHRVLTARTDRYSLTGWLLYQPSALGQLF